MTDDNDGKFEGWVILELMGHRRLIGYLTEQELAGHPYLRIDVLADPPSTQFYAPAAVYCITPTTEEMAKKASGLSRVAPISRWELPAAAPDGGDGQDEADDEVYDSASHPF